VRGAGNSEAEERIAAELDIPAGYWTAWGGQFEQLLSARQQLQVMVSMVLLLIFTLLFMTFRTVRDSLLMFTGIPLALTGGVLFLWVGGSFFSISAAVGFIAHSGVAVLNGLVMTTPINWLRAEASASDCGGAGFRPRIVATGGVGLGAGLVAPAGCPLACPLAPPAGKPASPTTTDRFSGPDAEPRLQSRVVPQPFTRPTAPPPCPLNSPIPWTP